MYTEQVKVAGEIIPNNIYILTFDSTEVSIGWNRCDVREYISRPRRCFKCQKQPEYMRELWKRSSWNIFSRSPQLQRTTSRPFKRLFLLQTIARNYRHTSEE